MQSTNNNNYTRSGDSSSASPQVQAPPPPPNPCATNPNYSTSTNQTIGPLLPEEWGQLDTYNDLCPESGCTNTIDGNAPTGCVATAIAQVIRYWQFPANIYDYSSMPNEEGNSAVQQLMVDAGRSVSMSYNCSGSHPPSEKWMPGGILTNTSFAEWITNAFKGTFGYNSAAYAMYSEGDYTDYTDIETDISNGEPVILGGYSGRDNTLNIPKGDGHSWVCDGTSQTTYSYCMNGSLESYTTLDFHMNWGWNEIGTTNNDNGWFEFNDWDIPDQGFNFQYFDEFTYNIHP